jgi:glycosyltransferase involved in cell wall biosynthesis
LQEHYDVASTVVPNGYPLADCYPPFEEREFFLWVGRLNRDQKRPHLFLDVAEKLPDKKFKLIGPKGDDDEYVEHLMERIGRLENVEYRGTVPPDQISEYYKKAVALVSTSKYEGFPNTFLEAWRVQTPVLSLSIDPRRYINVDEEYSGYCSDSTSKAVLKCNEMVNMREVWRKVSMNCRDRFESILSMKVTSNKYKNAILKFMC